MAFIAVFKSVNGEPLMTKQLGSDKIEAEKTLKLAIFDVVRLGKRDYRIIRINRKYAASQQFDQREPITQFEFTVEPIKESG